MSRHRAPVRSAVRTGMTAVAAGGVLTVGASGVATATSLHPGAGAPAPATAQTATEQAAADATAVVRLATEAGASRPVGVASLVPVADPAAITGNVAVSSLLKAAGLAEVALRADERGGDEGGDEADCDPDLDGLGRVREHVREAAEFLSCLYDEPDLIGVARRSGASDHPRGRAVDLMVRGERGDRLAECALENQEELGIDYVIWEQRVNHGEGWKRMSDRGGDTANHYDHVHVSFERSGSDDEPDPERCD